MRVRHSISGVWGISGVSILASAAVFAFAPALLAQTGGNRPNFTGVWDLQEAFSRSLAGPGAEDEPERRGVPRQGFSTEEPPMRPEAEAKYRQARQGVTSIYSSGGDEFDPTHSCFPHGMPRIYTTPRPFEIVQVPHVLVQMFDHFREVMDDSGQMRRSARLVQRLIEMRNGLLESGHRAVDLPQTQTVSMFRFRNLRDEQHSHRESQH